MKPETARPAVQPPQSARHAVARICNPSAPVLPSALIVLILILITQAAPAGPIEDWNAEFVAAIQAEATPPGLAARNLAIFHLAMHQAAQTDLPALNVAALSVSARLYPARRPKFESLFVHTRNRETFPETTPESQAAGRAAADKNLAQRADDGSTTTVHYVPKTEPGQWRRTPPNNRPPELPHWPKVRPFVLKSADQFRPDGPPALDSAAYAKALAEIRDLGGQPSAKRTEDQTLIARFWADFTYTSTPPGHWNEIARQATVAADLSPIETARVFALLNLALADAGIAAFDCKYHYNFWRPVTAIEGDWQPLLPTPPHPEYVSAHSAFSGAAAEILQQLLGEIVPEFEVRSIDVPDEIRRYTRFWDCANEVGLSRLWGGIHYRFSNEDGLALGKQVATWVLKKQQADTESG